MPILASDNFTRANENPLNPTNWTTVTGNNALQVVSNLCESTVAAARSWELFTNATWPNDQYSSVTVNAFANGSTTEIINVFARGSTSTTTANYQLRIQGAVSGNPTYTIFSSNLTLAGPTVLGAAVSSGDIFTLKCQGTTITAYKNGVQLTSLTDSHVASGSPGLAIETVTTITSVNSSLWTGGSIVTTAVPTFSPVAGPYATPQTVTITSSTANSTIYYTTDGSTPTTSSASIPSGGTISVSVTETVKAIALSNGLFDVQSTVASASYTIGSVATSTFTPIAGTYNLPIAVTLVNSNSGLSGFAQYYTTDGSTPTTGSTLYVNPIPVTSTTTIKVLAVATGLANSAIATGVFTNSGLVATQLASYAFTTVENPLSDAGNFTALNDTNFTGALKVPSSGICEAATTTQGGVFYSGLSWPNDQYSEITIATWASGANLSPLVILVRQGSAISGTMYLTDLIPGSPGIYILYSIVGGVTTQLTFGSATPIMGDVWRLAISGTTLTLLQNGVPIKSLTTSSISSGSTGFTITSPTVITNGQISLWAGGSYAASSASPNGFVQGFRNFINKRGMTSLIRH